MTISRKTTIRSVAPLVAGLVLLIAAVLPVGAGQLACSLQATVGGGSATEVEVGEEVLIEGTGFPFNTDVSITYMVDSTAVGGATVTTDGTGMFETNVSPQPGQEGLWTVQADAPKQCSATTTFEVFAPLQCQLQATVDGGSATEVEVGEEVLIEPTGFDPGGALFISYAVDGMGIPLPGGGNNQIEFGPFHVTPQHVGLWTVSASDQEGCTATTSFQVVASATPSPSPLESELPNVAVPAPSGGSGGWAPLGAEILGMLFVLAAALLVARPLLARRVR